MAGPHAPMLFSKAARRSIRRGPAYPGVTRSHAKHTTKHGSSGAMLQTLRARGATSGHFNVGKPYLPQAWAVRTSTYLHKSEYLALGLEAQTTAVLHSNGAAAW